MRYLLIGLLGLVLLWSCADDRFDDGDVASMEVMARALEAEPPPPPGDPEFSVNFKDEKTFDCVGGGYVLVKVQWSYRETPYSRKYYVTWDYSACVTWAHGTIDGEARYSTNNEDKSTFWFTGVHYYADLDYSGRRVAECDAYMQMSKETEDSIRNLAIREHCRHPVRHWWALWGVPQ
jgi:hypothetical protein